MTIETRTTKYTAETLYMALELGGSTWKLGFTVGLGRKARIVTIQAGDVAALGVQIRKAKGQFGLIESARVLSCYEAGRDGHWLHRHLLKLGITNVVVDPASVSVDRRARRAKTDRLDTEKLLRHLIRFQDDPQEWRVVNVPSPEVEDERHLHREQRTLTKERTQHVSRLKSLLVLHGIRMSVTKTFLKRLGECQLPPQLMARLRREYERFQLVCDQLLEIKRQRRALVKAAKTKLARQTQRLSHLRGIGEPSAWVFSSEMFSWRELRNRGQVGGLLGLTPTPFNSDGIQREQGISKAGLRHVRALAIEIAWCWLRYQPQSRLSCWFKERFGHGQRSRKVGIVALARKLMIALWRYAEHGIVPEGALLKA